MAAAACWADMTRDHHLSDALWVEIIVLLLLCVSIQCRIPGNRTLARGTNHLKPKQERREPTSHQHVQVL